MTSITVTINNLTYDILGKVIKNDRSGTSGDMSYLIYKNGNVSRYNFDGGFISFNSKGSVTQSSCRLYIQDYQGNNRMLVNAYNNGIEQNTHYYPYGGLISDIGSNPDGQDYKYGGKELDRTYGLDLYDFHARQYDATVPAFTSIDPMAEKYYGISPYAYCAGDPVNCIDPTGCDTLSFLLRDGEHIADYQYRIKSEGDHVGMVYNSNHELVSQFSFVYEDDAAKFGDNSACGIVFVPMDKIDALLSKIPENLSLPDALKFALNGSRGTGDPMDFVNIGFIQDEQKMPCLFIPEDGANIAHDAWNFGNYLWGAAMDKLGIPYPIACAGAHADNYFRSAKSAGQSDSFDDQCSIALGYNRGSAFYSKVSACISEWYANCAIIMLNNPAILFSIIK